MAGEVRIIVAGIGGHGIDGGGPVGRIDVVPGFSGWEVENLVADFGGKNLGVNMEEGVSFWGILHGRVPVIGDGADSEDWGQNISRAEEALLDEGVQFLLEDPVGTDDLVGKDAPLLHDLGVLGEEVPLGVGFPGPHVVWVEVVPKVGLWLIEEDEEGGVVIINLGFSHGVVVASGAVGLGDRVLAGRCGQ